MKSANEGCTKAKGKMKMKKPITVVITTWQVPYDQIIVAQSQFTTTEAAVEFINQRSAQWWKEKEGQRCIKEHPETDPYQPIEELGYDMACYRLWGGESGFHAMLDADSAAMLHEAYYKRECDDKGLPRPGYLINTYVAGQKPGGMTEDEAAKYAEAQAKGMAAIENAYGKPVKH